MLKKLRENPLLSSLLVLLLYAGLFILPAFFVQSDPEQHGISGVDGAISQWPTQLVFGVIFILIVSLLGWWGKIGFRGINQGGLKFLLPPFLLALSLLIFSNMNAHTDHWFLGFDRMKQLFGMVLVMLALGFTEETMFRGVLFHGLETRFTPLITVMGSAVIFGLFHFVNLLVDAGFYDTAYQVLHAAAAGFMYASLRLRLGAIWPVMLFHGFWDFSLFTSQTMSGVVAGADTTSSFSLLRALLIMLPAFIYGLYVYWRWSVWYRSQPETGLASGN